MSFRWSKDTYEQSLSSRCWWFTPYDGGQWSDTIRADEELRQVVEMETALGDVPQWAQQIVERTIRSACPCGHYLFPQPYLEVLDAIGAQAAPDLVHSCFTVARTRKRQAQDYALCLDAWLAGAPPEAPARELAALGYRQIDWHAACADLWQTLGERTEVKELLVERMLQDLRWSIKFTFWDGDPATAFGRVTSTWATMLMRTTGRARRASTATMSVPRSTTSRPRRACSAWKRGSTNSCPTGRFGAAS